MLVLANQSAGRGGTSVSLVCTHSDFFLFVWLQHRSSTNATHSVTNTVHRVTNAVHRVTNTGHRCRHCNRILTTMNIGSKNKKRVVLPSRPDPPTVDQILEDINSAALNDPIFSILEQMSSDSTRLSNTEMEVKFQQCRRYLELNERLQQARGQLLRQREELRAAGEHLGRDVEEVKGQGL